jgi:hypothetical protein
MDMEMELRLRRLSDFKSSNLDESFGSMLQSPSSRQSQMNHYPSSPVRQHGFESSASMAAAAVMNARSSAFAKRSLSFKPAPVASSNVSDWGSPNGKVEWGMQREELNKLRRSVSFGIHGNNNNNVSPRPVRDYSDEPDVSWVNSLVKESGPERAFGLNGERVGNTVNGGGGAVREQFKLPSWAEQMYIDHEKHQIVA